MSRSLQSRSKSSINAGTADDQVDVVPEISTKPLKKRRRLSRDRFDALYLASRKVDSGLLQQVDPTLTDEQTESDKLADRMAERVRLNRRSATSLLSSFVVHLGLVLVLVLFLTIPSKQKPRIGLEASFISDPIEIPPTPETKPDKIKIKAEVETVTEAAVESTAEDTLTDLVNEKANDVNREPNPVLSNKSSPMSVDAQSLTRLGNCQRCRQEAGFKDATPTIEPSSPVLVAALQAANAR